MPPSVDNDALNRCLISPKPDLNWTRPPKSRWRKILWRWRIWIEVTFVLSMLEPWEKIMLIVLFASFNLLLLAGITVYLPTHLVHLHKRTMYYLWGNSSALLPDSSTYLLYE